MGEADRTQHVVESQTATRLPRIDIPLRARRLGNLEVCIKRAVNDTFETTASGRDNLLLQIGPRGQLDST